MDLRRYQLAFLNKSPFDLSIEIRTSHGQSRFCSVPAYGAGQSVTTVEAWTRFFWPATGGFGQARRYTKLDEGGCAKAFVIKGDLSVEERPMSYFATMTARRDLMVRIKNESEEDVKVGFIGHDGEEVGAFVPSGTDAYFRHTGALWHTAQATGLGIDVRSDGGSGSWISQLVVTGHAARWEEGSVFSKLYAFRPFASATVRHLVPTANLSSGLDDRQDDLLFEKQPLSTSLGRYRRKPEIPLWFEGHEERGPWEGAHRMKNEGGAVAWSPKGRMVATASGAGAVAVWDAGTGELMRVMKDHPAVVTGVAWSPDGHTIAAASKDRYGVHAVVLWNATTGESLRVLGPRNPYAVAWSPDRRMVAVTAFAENHHIAELLDATSGVRVHLLKGHTNWLHGVAWSPDGRMVATASHDKTAALWDAATGERVQLLEGHSNYVVRVAWSPNGRTVATTSFDHTAALWDAATGKQLRVLTGHSFWVSGVAWSPQGYMVATASYDGTVVIWDAATGEQLRIMGNPSKIHEAPNLGGAVTGVAWDPDGDLVATVSLDHTAALWDTATGEQVRVLFSGVGAYLAH